MNRVDMKWTVKENATNDEIMGGSLFVAKLDTDELGEVGSYMLGTRGQLSKNATGDYTLTLAASGGSLDHTEDFQIDDNKLNQIIHHMANGSIKLADFRAAHKKQKGKP